MNAVFVELPPFERYRTDYLNDEGFRELQMLLIAYPEAGEVIVGAGGLRKVRFADEKRGKGKRGGLRIIYFWWQEGQQFWLFALYNKDEMDDLTVEQKRTLKGFLKLELETRRIS
jgi:hypothetical protein